MGKKKCASETTEVGDKKNRINNDSNSVWLKNSYMSINSAIATASRKEEDTRGETGKVSNGKEKASKNWKIIGTKEEKKERKQNKKGYNNE